MLETSSTRRPRRHTGPFTPPPIANFSAFATQSTGKALIQQARVVVTCALAVATVIVLPPAASGQSDTAPATTPSSVAESIVVSAEREAHPAATIGSTVTVIERAELERSAAPLLLEALRHAVGIEITQSGSPGRVTTLRIRGGDASHTLVLLDGLRINSTTTGDYDWGNLLASDIERVEILRGPQAIYGSEAVSGVISLETRAAEAGRHLFALVEAGNEGASRLVAGGGVANERWNGRLQVSDYRIEDLGQKSERLGFTEPDPYDNQSISARGGVVVGRGGRLDASLHGSSGTSEVDGFFAEALDAEQETEELHSSVRYLGTFGDWQQTVRVSFSTTDLIGRDSAPSFDVFDIRSQTAELYGETDWQASDRNRLTVALTREEREAHNLGTFEEEASIGSLMVHDRQQFGENAFVTLAARHDDHSVFGSETTGRATLAWLARPDHANRGRLHSSIGTAFRAPDFNELFFPFAGDPNLRPETSSGFDIGWEQHFANGRGRFDLTAFRTEFEDLIVFDLGSFLFANVAEARSAGLELESLLRLGELSLGFNYSWNDTEDLATGAPLPRRPKNRGSATLSWAPDARLRTLVQALRVADRIESTGEPMDDYTRIDLALSYRLNEHVEPYLRINNLLDRDYEEVEGFETPGFLAAIGVRLRR